MTLRHEPEVGRADWFANSGEDWRQLCSIGPSGFAAYARIMHPADSEIADEQSRLLCAEGDLDETLLHVLVEVLARHTSTPVDCFFGLWIGYGEIHGSMVTRIVHGEVSTSWMEPPAFESAVLDGPKVQIPKRAYFLFRGPVQDAGRWPSRNNVRINSPSLAWPADRSWFVATDTDSPWTGVGGSAELIDELTAKEALDVVPAYASPDLPYARE
jgi:hypothetical protein